MAAYRVYIKGNSRLNLEQHDQLLNQLIREGRRVQVCGLIDALAVPKGYELREDLTVETIWMDRLLQENFKRKVFACIEPTRI